MTSRVEHSVDVARKLNKSLRLENVAVAGIKAEANSFAEPPFKFAMKLGAVHWTRNGTNLLAFFPVEVDIQVGDLEALASLSVLMRGTYGIGDEPTEEQIAAVPHYLGIVGWMQVWPYVRSEIQELSTKLGFPPLTLPVLLTGQTRHVPVRASDDVDSDEEGHDADEELSLSSD